MKTELSRLTVPASRGQTATRHRHIVMAGIGVPKPLGARSAAYNRGFFLPIAQAPSMTGWARPSNGAGSKWPVRQPRPVRPHVIGVARGRVNNPHLESTMSHDTPTGEIRPNTATSTTSAAGPVEWRWVKEATLIKRIRRKLAERNHSLLITRAGTAARREFGRFAVVGERHEILNAGCEIEALARFLGVLDDDERIELPPFRGWRWYAGKHRVKVVDGIRFHYVDRMTRDYSSEKALTEAMAKAGITDATVVSYKPSAISFDGPISGQEGSHGE